jgi:outer membrane receptor protein involved in Fe transport
MDLQYQSEQIQGNDFSNTEQRIPSCFIGGFSMQWAYRSNIDFTLRINNLFDRNYITTAYSGGLYPGPGREFRAGVRASF